jgi:hypothetical protein
VFGQRDEDWHLVFKRHVELQTILAATPLGAAVSSFTEPQTLVLIFTLTIFLNFWMVPALPDRFYGVLSIGEAV